MERTGAELTRNPGGVRGQSVMATPRLLADAMLGGLVRWLRVLDLDTVYRPELDDHALVALAAREERILLTRDRHLITFLRPPRYLAIASDRPLSQLREVVAGCALQPPPALFQRCLVCNTPLRDATEAEALELAPPSSRAFSDPIRRCPGCGRVYWLGSHTRRMRATLGQALPEWFR